MSDEIPRPIKAPDNEFMRTFVHGYKIQKNSRNTKTEKDGRTRTRDVNSFTSSMKIKSEAPPDVTHRIQKSSNIKPSDATLRVKKLLKPDTQSTSKFAGLQIPKNSSSSFTQQAETHYASSSKIIMKKLNNVKNSSLSNENVKFLKTFSEPAHDGFIIPEPTDPHYHPN
ncbi:hypothetical protein D9757_013956 [Collybiopsis confluens]|uniref:Uncharacterized protein n=1 Tax=Collybiopsis confluens TaxID=2823264 RepID=A0A8H5G5J4_9AGAR|nr:hypothetical protein D9757_013956 [Collybiopsis confluens]